jgi:hypothetical protein
MIHKPGDLPVIFSTFGGKGWNQKPKLIPALLCGFFFGRR